MRPIDLRCSHCNRKIGEVDAGTKGGLHIKCRRCGLMNHVTLTGSGSADERPVQQIYKRLYSR